MCVSSQSDVAMWIRRIFAMLVAGAFLLPAVASAAQPPAELPVQGYLSQADGAPVDGEVTMQLAIYDSDGEGDGGNELHSEMVTAQVRDGSFTTHLAPDDLSMFRNNSNLWLEITVDGETIEPRMQLATVPYAANAEYADAAATAESLSEDASDAYQTNISEDACNEGEHAVGINDDGTLQCSPTASVASGHGLSKDDGTLRVDYSGVSDLTCSGDDKVTGINADGTPICGTDSDTQVGAGTHLSKMNGDLHLDYSGNTNRTCPGDQKMTGLKADGTPICGPDAAGVESVTAGAGLTDSGNRTNPNLDVSVSSNEIQTGAVGSGQISNGSVTGAKIDSSSQITASGFEYNTTKTRKTTITGSDFHLNSNGEDDIWTTSATLSQAGYIEADPPGDGANVVLRSSLPIPHGATVVGASCTVRDNHSNTNIDATFEIYPPTATLDAKQKDIKTTGQSTNNQTFSTSLPKPTNVAFTASRGTVGFTIDWAHTNPGGSRKLQLRNCTVEYEVTSL